MTQSHRTAIIEMAPDVTPQAGPETSGDAHTPVENTIAQIWAKVLGLERVDIHENFLLLGGESLMATQVAAEVLSEVGVEVPIRSILVGTVAEVAEEVAAKLGAAA